MFFYRQGINFLFLVDSIYSQHIYQAAPALCYRECSPITRLALVASSVMLVH